MRTRDEVLAELRQRIGTDDYCQSDVNGIDLYAMADHIVAVERQRDEYHAMWTKETLAKRELADRIRELEAQQAASEPVAWALCSADGKAILADTETDYLEKVRFQFDRDDAADAPHSLRPLVFGDVAHPSAAAVREAYERGRRDALKDLAASIPKYPTYYPDVNLGPDDVGEPAASEGASA